MDNKINTIKQTIKENTKILEQKKYLFVFLGVIIVLLTFIFFQYTFEQMNTKKTSNFIALTNKNKTIQRNFNKLPSCVELTNLTKNNINNNNNTNITTKPILADYFINSSYNSALIGNQSQDYLSIDFLKNVILAGARYLEFQINASNMSDYPEPVIGTGDLVGNWKTSRNSLIFTDVLKVIKQYSFNGNMNYPLIIYFDFNSHNKHLIKRVGELLSDYLEIMLIKNSKYKKTPITFEKLCVLNKKIIILTSLPENELIQTPLEKINIPNLGFIKRFYYEDAKKFINMSGNIENTLTNDTQEKDKEIYNQHYTSMIDILAKKDNGEDYLENLVKIGINNPLLYFNKVGISIIIPHKKTDNFTLNIQSDLYWDNGCQIVAMNFQEYTKQGIFDNINKMIVDKTEFNETTPIMIKYLHKFNNNSFIIKADDFRFIEKQETPENIFDTDDIEKREKTELDLINNFYENNRNMVFAIQSYSTPNKMLNTNYNGFIRFNTTYEAQNKNLFMLFPSFDEDLNIKGGFMISKSNELIPLNYKKRKYITQKNSDFIYRKIPIDSEDLINQSTFYAVKPSCKETSINDNIIVVSFRNSEEYDPSYLGFNQNLLTTYQENTSIKMRDNCCFNLIKQNVKKYIYIKNKETNLFLFCNHGGLCSFKGSNPNKSFNRFEIISEYEAFLTDGFYLKGRNGKLLSYKCDKLLADMKTIDDTYTSYFKFEINKNYERLTLYDPLTKEYNTYLQSKKNNALFVDERKPKINKLLDDNCDLVQKAKYYNDNRLLNRELQLDCYIEYEII